MSKHLRGVSRLALFICTIGSDLPNRVNEYVAKGEIARATILDAVGSEFAEALAQRVDDLIRAQAKREGFSASRRFSPGYGDWTVFDQAKILKILKANRLGVKVTKSCIMVPEKSVTACIGLVKRGPRPIRKVYEGHIKSAKR
ncbi:MAG: vitamin B12 dependent-methionine synthase activation domain-containing protein [Candidatus Omnitrophota bacterium]